jgi:hypothetical protein
VARWNTLWWPVGATVLAALVVAGCGAAGKKPEDALHATAEKKLLTLVAHARSDVQAHNGAAAHTDLSEFVAEVGTLRSSGKLSHRTASRLDRQALTTAAQIKKQIPASPTSDVTQQPATTTSSQAAVVTTSTPPAAAATPPITKPGKPDPGAEPPPPASQPHDAAKFFGDGNHPFPHGQHGDHGGHPHGPGDGNGHD